MKPVFSGLLVGAAFAIAANVLLVLSLLYNGPHEGVLVVAAALALVLALLSVGLVATMRAVRRGHHPSRRLVTSSSQ
jgi:hypothetical protein